MREYHVLNLGAGVQSTALYLLARDGEYHFDVAIFADTQEEPQSVYDHLTWLQSLGNPPIWVRTGGKLGDDLINGVGPKRRFLSVPAFTQDEKGKLGLIRRQCTRHYKIDVIQKAIRNDLIGLKFRQHMPKDVRVFQYFGI